MKTKFRAVHLSPGNKKKKCPRSLVCVRNHAANRPRKLSTFSSISSWNWPQICQIVHILPLDQLESFGGEVSFICYSKHQWTFVILRRADVTDADRFTCCVFFFFKKWRGGGDLSNFNLCKSGPGDTWTSGWPRQKFPFTKPPTVQIGEHEIKMKKSKI